MKRNAAGINLYMKESKLQNGENFHLSYEAIFTFRENVTLLIFEVALFANFYANVNFSFLDPALAFKLTVVLDGLMTMIVIMMMMMTMKIRI